MAYWIPVENGVRVFESTLKDAYLTAAKTLLGTYRRTNGRIHLAIREYEGSTSGIPIYDTQKGRTFTHWVRFSNGANPSAGYEECRKSKEYGVAYKVKSFPKNW